jgi:hypothetical protein
LSRLAEDSVGVGQGLAEAERLFKSFQDAGRCSEQIFRFDQQSPCRHLLRHSGQFSQSISVIGACE